MAVAFSQSGATGYVVNTVSGTVTPVSAATGVARKAISVGTYSYPLTITMITNSSLAAVVDPYSGQISTINLATGAARKPINLGDTTFPLQIAIVP
jgi:hypothetical protein